MVDFVLKIIQFSKKFEYKIDHNSKTEIFINRKFHFSFVSAHCASLKKIGPFLREGEGVCGSLIGNSPNHLERCIDLIVEHLKHEYEIFFNSHKLLHFFILVNY